MMYSMTNLKSLFIALVMMFSSVTAFGENVFPFTEPMINYSGEGNVSLTFDSCDDILALLTELEALDTLENFVDVKSLLTSLISYNADYSFQYDISEDFSAIKYAADIQTKQDITVNPNLKIGVDTNSGFWFDSDFSDAENPKLDIAVILPILNKYLKINYAELTADISEAEQQNALNMMKYIFSTEYINSLTAYSSELIDKYTTTQHSGNKYTMKINNQNMIDMINDARVKLPELIAPVMKNAGLSEEEISGMLAEIDSYPRLSNVQLLGADGITLEYILDGKNILSSEIVADISFDISQIYASLTGMEWEYVSHGIIDFTLKISQKNSEIGTTKVSFPELNENNSFGPSDYINEIQSDYEDYEEYTPYYPDCWSFGTVAKSPVVDGNHYLPLRPAIESAFSDSAQIYYDNGVITLTSDYFPGFKNLYLFVGGDKAYTDTEEYPIGQVILEDGVTYVNISLFEDVFGWTLDIFTYDILNNEYYFDFSTNIGE